MNPKTLRSIHPAPRRSLWLLTPALLAGFSLQADETAAAQPSAAKQDSPTWVELSPVTVSGSRSYSATAAGTATRTDTPITEIPQSVQVITRSLIDEQQLHQLSDALANVSGVQAVRANEAILVSPQIRGFNADIYVDGLPNYGATSTVDPGSLIGIQSVEVVKGPSSNLFGGGGGAPLGGIINLVTRTPNATASRELGLRLGSFATLNPFFDVNQPVVNGVAVRLSGELERSYSHIDAVKNRRYALFPSIAIDLAEQTHLTLRGQLNRNAYLEYSGLPAEITVTGSGARRNAFSGARDTPTTVVSNQGLSATLDHRLADPLQAIVDVRWYSSQFVENSSFAFPAFFPADPESPTTFPIATALLPTDVREITVDPRIVYRRTGETFDNRLTVGAQYDRTHYFAQLGFNFMPVGSIDYADPDSDVAYGPIPAISLTQDDYFETKALYVQDQLTLATRWHLLAGLRYEYLDFEQRSAGVQADYYRFSPRGGVTFDVLPGLSTFAGYSQGFRALTNVISATTPVPETSRSIETGVKFALQPAGLSGTVALFQLRRQNVPTPSPADPFVQIQTGEQRAQGLETDLVWEPTRALSVLFTYAFTDAEVTEDNSLPVGDRLPRTPRHSGRIATRYRVSSGPLRGLGIGAGLSAGSKREITLPNTIATEAYYSIDAQGSYRWRNYELGVSVINLTNNRYFEPYQFLAQPVVRPAQPLSVFATLAARF